MDKKAILITVICSIVLTIAIWTSFAIAASKKNNSKSDFKNTESASGGQAQSVRQYYPECADMITLDSMFSNEKYGVVLHEHNKELMRYTYNLGKDPENATSILTGYLTSLESKMGLEYETADQTDFPMYLVKKNSKNIAVVAFSGIADLDNTYLITVQFMVSETTEQETYESPTPAQNDSLPYSKGEYESMVSDLISSESWRLEYELRIRVRGCESIKNVKVTKIECTKYDEDEKYAEVTVKGSFTAYDEYGSVMDFYVFDAVYHTDSDGRKLWRFPLPTVRKR